MGCAPINNDSKIITISNSTKNRNGPVLKEEVQEFHEFDLLYDQKTRKNYMTIKVKLFISCQDLYKPSNNTKGNFLIILYNVSQDNQLIEEGKTEISRDNFSPLFIKTFVLHFQFISTLEKQQKYLLVVYNINSSKFYSSIEEEKYLGESEFQMDHLIANNELKLLLKNKNSTKKEIYLGNIIVKAVEIEENSDFISFDIGIKGVLSRNEVGCKIFWKSNNNERLPIFETKDTIQKSKEFFWDNVELDLHKLKFKDKESIIKFEIFEVLKNEKIKIKSRIEVLISDFLEKEDHYLPLYPGNDRTQHLLIKNLKKFTKFKFYDFLISNLDIKCFLFWDFSNSKINRRKKDFLVSRNKKISGLMMAEFKEEEKYINSIVNEIEQVQYLCNTILKYLSIDFDTDNKLPFFGFGCRFPNDEYSSIECFAVTKDIINPEVYGLDIYEKYIETLREVELHGPSTLSECTKLFLKYLQTENYTDKYQFYALAIYVISSPICDLLDFIELVNETSYHPCSIIILSIGSDFNADDMAHFNYSEVSELEALFLKYDRKMKTTPFRKNTYFLNFNNLILTHNQNLLNNSVLTPILKNFSKEITNQFLEYVNKKNIAPIQVDNQKNKSINTYFEFRTKKQLERYSVPHYLTEEMNHLIDDLQLLGISLNDLMKEFKTVPTFERHYLVNELKRSAYKRSLIQEKVEKNTTVNRSYLIYKNKTFIDERESILQKHEIKKLEVMKDEKFSPQYDNKLCNICRNYNINIVFQDCKHRFCCEHCVELNSTTCKICSKKIKKFVKVYDV